MLGGNSVLEPPLPISNRAVKQFCADDSMLFAWGSSMMRIIYLSFLLFVSTLFNASIAADMACNCDNEERVCPRDDLTLNRVDDPLSMDRQQDELSANRSFDALSKDSQHDDLSRSKPSEDLTAKSYHEVIGLIICLQIVFVTS